jgi:uncharacterized membrane protein/uncharacterized protein YerC
MKLISNFNNLPLPYLAKIKCLSDDKIFQEIIFKAIKSDSLDLHTFEKMYEPIYKYDEFNKTILESINFHNKDSTKRASSILAIIYKNDKKVAKEIMLKLIEKLNTHNYGNDIGNIELMSEDVFLFDFFINVLLENIDFLENFLISSKWFNPLNTQKYKLKKTFHLCENFISLIKPEKINYLIELYNKNNDMDHIQYFIDFMVIIAGRGNLSIFSNNFFAALKENLGLLFKTIDKHSTKNKFLTTNLQFLQETIMSLPNKDDTYKILNEYFDHEKCNTVLMEQDDVEFLTNMCKYFCSNLHVVKNPCIARLCICYFSHTGDSEQDTGIYTMKNFTTIDAENSDHVFKSFPINDWIKTKNILNSKEFFKNKNNRFFLYKYIATNDCDSENLVDIYNALKGDNNFGSRVSGFLIGNEKFEIVLNGGLDENTIKKINTTLATLEKINDSIIADIVKHYCVKEIKEINFDNLKSIRENGKLLFKSIANFYASETNFKYELLFSTENLSSRNFFEKYGWTKENFFDEAFLKQISCEDLKTYKPNFSILEMIIDQLFNTNNDLAAPVKCKNNNSFALVKYKNNNLTISEICEKISTIGKILLADEKFANDLACPKLNIAVACLVAPIPSTAYLDDTHKILFDTIKEEYQSKNLSFENLLLEKWIKNKIFMQYPNLKFLLHHFISMGGLTKENFSSIYDLIACDADFVKSFLKGKYLTNKKYIDIAKDFFLKSESKFNEEIKTCIAEYGHDDILQCLNECEQYDLIKKISEYGKENASLKNQILESENYSLSSDLLKKYGWTTIEDFFDLTFTEVLSYEIFKNLCEKNSIDNNTLLTIAKNIFQLIFAQNMTSAQQSDFTNILQDIYGKIVPKNSTDMSKIENPKLALLYLYSLISENFTQLSLLSEIGTTNELSNTKIRWTYILNAPFINWIDSRVFKNENFDISLDKYASHIFKIIFMKFLDENKISIEQRIQACKVISDGNNYEEIICSSIKDNITDNDMKLLQKIVTTIDNDTQNPICAGNVFWTSINKNQQNLNLFIKKDYTLLLNCMKTYKEQLSDCCNILDPNNITNLISNENLDVNFFILIIEAILQKNIIDKNLCATLKIICDHIFSENSEIAKALTNPKIVLLYICWRTCPDGLEKYLRTPYSDGAADRDMVPFLDCVSSELKNGIVPHELLINWIKNETLTGKTLNFTFAIILVNSIAHGDHNALQGILLQEARKIFSEMNTDIKTKILQGKNIEIDQINFYSNYTCNPSNANLYTNLHNAITTTSLSSVTHSFEQSQLVLQRKNIQPKHLIGLAQNNSIKTVTSSKKWMIVSGIISVCTLLATISLIFFPFGSCVFSIFIPFIGVAASHGIIFIPSGFFILFTISFLRKYRLRRIVI